MPDITWFLAQLKPNSARIAQENLHRQGFETFLPLEARTQTRNGRFVTTDAPLFPGYIFVSFDPGAGVWRQVNATRGVTQLVSLAGAPTPVPEGIVTALMARCDADGRVQDTPNFTPGDAVVVKAGAFADVATEILAVDPDRRIWVLLDIMGRRTRTAMPPDNLRKR